MANRKSAPENIESHDVEGEMMVRGSKEMIYADRNQKMMVPLVDIIAIGKVKFYGDFVTRLMVKTKDNIDVGVNMSSQPDMISKKWMEKQSRLMVKRHIYPSPNRDAGVDMVWMKVEKTS